MAYKGEIAGLLTAVFWTITAVSFEFSSKRIGSLAVNILRLLLGFLLLGIFSWITRGFFLPSDAGTHQWLWLCLSGIIGFTIGDFALFQAFVLVGARVALLVMSLVPPMAAFFSYVFMGEKMGLMNFAGMMLTLAGIALAIIGRDKGRDEVSGKKVSVAYATEGILLALLGALGQAGGLVMSKYGMGSYDAFSASQIRVIAGIAGFFLIFTVFRKWAVIPAALHDGKAMGYMSLGAFFGPFLGVSFSLIAVQNTATGIASTLMAITPVLIIPAAVYFFGEKLRWKEIVGAVLAVGGVAVFFL